MLEKAISKIKSEVEGNNNPYVQVVGNFLLQHLENNPESADKILDNDKTIIKSLDEMKKAAEKNKVGNCAVLTDQEGFEAVLQYYGIEGAVPNYVSSVDLASGPDKSVVNNQKSTEIDFDVKLEDLM